jgi:hypothetical protein
MTFWEQIDENVMFSPTKKRFLIIPLFLFFIFFLKLFFRTALAIWANSSTFSIYLNLGAFLFQIAGKLPMFHKVRLFGINKD